MEYNHLQEILTSIESSKLAILIASTKDCSVCLAIKPRIKQLLKDDTQVKQIDIWIDTLLEASGEFMIFTVPTIILFAEGKEVHRESRIIDFKRLEFELSRWKDYLVF